MMKVYKNIHLRWSNGDYSGESFFQAFAILYPFTQEDLEQVLATRKNGDFEAHLRRQMPQLGQYLANGF